MLVIKRDGTKQTLDLGKLEKRVSTLAAASFQFPRRGSSSSATRSSKNDVIVLEPLTRHVDCSVLVAAVRRGMFPGISTEELDALATKQAADHGTEHPDYLLLGGRLAVARLHDATDPDPVRVWRKLQSDSFVHGRAAPPMSPQFMDDVDWLAEHHPWLFYGSDAKQQNHRGMDHRRDYLIEYFGLATLKKAYLLRLRTATDKDGAVVERPQHLWMRVAIMLHGRDAEKVQRTYDLLSLKQCIHATPTLFNAGGKCGQLASCFLLPVADDSLIGIMDTVKECALISKGSGGIGLSVSNVRGRGSAIISTGGSSNGLIPMMHVYEKTVRYVDQGGGKRPGSACVYLEPWHPDILDFVQQRRPVGGDANSRVRELFYAVWMCDLFMRRLIAKGGGAEWSLFCPAECPGLNETHGAEFEALYERYEREGRARSTIAPQKIWEAMLASQQEAGMPFLLFKDAVNRACNQSNLGTIRSSNLCCEVTQFTSPDEIAVCNLASIGLPSMVVQVIKKRTTLAPAITASSSSSSSSEQQPLPAVTASMLDRSGSYVDYAHLYEVAYETTINLNRVLDIGIAPLDKAQRSNEQHRPLGLGVQGLADVFYMLGVDFESAEARKHNLEIFETLYFGALSASAFLAERDGPYATFWGSPASRGQLQFDLATCPNSGARTGSWVPNDVRHDWTALKAKIMKTGLRNSLVVALMPTASTSQILGYNECFEPLTSNVYVRKTLSGQFLVLNKYMVQDLEALGRWRPEIVQELLRDNGSVAKLEGLPDAFKRRYRTATEMSMATVINLAADRQAFVCQSQSMNCFMAEPSTSRLTRMHVYSWQSGLKTGMYYLHQSPVVNAQKFSVVPPEQRVLVPEQGGAEEEHGGGGVCESCSA